MTINVSDLLARITDGLKSGETRNFGDFSISRIDVPEDKVDEVVKMVQTPDGKDHKIEFVPEKQIEINDLKLAAAKKQAENVEYTLDSGISAYIKEFDEENKSNAPYFIRENDEEWKDKGGKNTPPILLPEIRLSDAGQITNFSDTSAACLRHMTMNMVGANQAIMCSGEDYIIADDETTRNVNTEMISKNFNTLAKALVDDMASTILRTIVDMAKIKGINDPGFDSRMLMPGAIFNVNCNGMYMYATSLRNYITTKVWVYVNDNGDLVSKINNNTINQIAAATMSGVVAMVQNAKFSLSDPGLYGKYDDFIKIFLGEEQAIQSFILETLHELARSAMIHISIIRSICGSIPGSKVYRDMSDYCY